MFVFIRWENTFFWTQQNFVWGTKRNLGGTVPECSRCYRHDPQCWWIL